MRLVRQTVWIAFDMLRARYAATKLGAIWAVAQPALMFFIFWFVSVYGLKMTASTGVPFFAYLFCGLLPWVTFSGAVSDGAGAVGANRHLVTQADFPLIVVPLAAVLSNMLVHLPLLLIVVFIFVANDVMLTSQVLMLPIFYLGLAIVSFAFVLPLSVLSVRSADVSQAVNVILLLLFWTTPIVWPLSNLSPELLDVLSLNPLFWIVGGYRHALLGLPLPGSAFYFASVIALTLSMLAIGVMLFRYFRGRLGDYM